MTRLRLISLGLFFTLFFGVVIFRAGRLQLFPHVRVESLAKRQLEQRVEIVARRGNVSDRNGKELAISSNSLSIYVNPKLVKDVSKIARQLGPILGQNEAALKAKIKDSQSKKFIWLARQIDQKQMELLGQIDLKTLDGVGVLPEFRRVFPQRQLAAQILGFVSIDGAGLEGIERLYQKELVGEKSSVMLSHDALGRPVFSHREQIRMDLNHGSDVELTLDSRLQYSAERALKDAVDFHEAESGTAIVMDPHNGEILAMANYPTFDPNESSTARKEGRRNRSLTDPIEPGSVLKPFVVGRALEDNVVRMDSMIPTFGGKIQVGRKVIGEADAHHRFEQVSVVDLIRLSSNVGTVVLKNKLGWPRVEDTFRKLGFGATLGIELSGESKGIFNSPKPNQILEQATMSFGQGISITPLHLAQAYSVIANGGVRVKPHILRKILGPNGVVELPAEDFRGERVFSEATSQKLRNLLERVVEGEGTGVRAKVDGFSVAGKTGTSQRVDFRNGGYESGAYWSVFSGFIPSDKPRFVISVIIDRPQKNGYYGGVVAAPVFSKIAQAAVRLSQSEFDIKKSLSSVDSLANIRNSGFDRGRKSALSRSVLPQDRVPELSGLPLSNALHLLQERGLKAEILQKGFIVIDQMPVGGSQINSTQPVYLKLR